MRGFRMVASVSKLAGSDIGIAALKLKIVDGLVMDAMLEASANDAPAVDECIICACEEEVDW